LSFAARFLVHPELFPARLSGESAGAESVVLEIAGAAHAVSGLSAGQRRGIEERFQGFLTDAAPGEATHSRVFRMAPDEFVGVDTRGWDYDLDLEHTEDSVKVAGLRLLARLAWRPRLTGALWTAADDEEFPGAVENYLRLLVAYELLERGGALVHSAGIVNQDGAHVFAGVSGAGKSTLARLSREEGLGVLSDDLNALAPSEAGFAALAVPFAGDLRGDARGGAHALRAVVALRKGAEHAWGGRAAVANLALLTSCAPYVNRDPYRTEHLMANLAGVLGSTESLELTFAPRPGVWRTLAVRA
jgi:hypothetical protein